MGGERQPSFSTRKPSLAHPFISICPEDQFPQQKISRGTTGKDRYTIHEQGVLHSLPQTLSTSVVTEGPTEGITYLHNKKSCS